MSDMAISGNMSGMPPKGVDPNAYAEQYAQEKGISVEEAKQELKTKFGDPQQQQGGASALSNSLSGADSTTSSGIPQSELEKLMAAGIPEEVIAQGDNAIMQFAQENNITLPEKQTGSKLDIDSYSAF